MQMLRGILGWWVAVAGYSKGWIWSLLVVIPVALGAQLQQPTTARKTASETRSRPGTLAATHGY